MAKSIVENSSASVGCLKVQLSDGAWVKSGTAFRVPGGPRRMVTARHVLSALMTPQGSVAAANPFRANGVLRKACVAFDDDGQDTVFHIETVLWAHPKWDMLVFDLDADPGRPPLEIETTICWGQGAVSAIGIVSYPVCAATELDLSLLEAAIGAPLGVKRLSLGRATCNPSVAPVAPRARAVLCADQHDASTLQGSSGAPVFDLATGRVVGVHFNGRGLDRRLPFNRNFAVNLPLAMAEPHLRQAVCDPALPLANIAPVAWDPNRSFDVGASETALGFDGPESVLPGADSPALADIMPDPPDFRDLPYRPSLGIARDGILPEPDQLPEPGDQMGEPSCAGFALAAAINMELIRAGRAKPVSARMLYEMARLHDEWADDDTGGTSLRGAIKGFYHNGVCSSETARYHPGHQDWTFSITAAKEARRITLGAYYRLSPLITDFQAALNEVGAIVVSAHVHSGWLRPTRSGRIPVRKVRTGTHAFTIVGYDDEGFVILNSWGAKWSAWEGRPGLAHWSYRDWGENMIDAWVLRLAPSAPSAFNVVAKARRDEVKAGEGPTPLAHLPVPRRNKLVGHVVQAERDGIVGTGRTGMTLPSLRETALYLGSPEALKEYPVLLFFLHDPFLGLETLTRLCGHLVDPLKQAGIYPIHILYGLDEVETVRLRIIHEAAAAKKRMAGSGDAIDDVLERRARQTCGRLLTGFAEGAVEAAKEGGPLWQITTSVLIEAAADRRTALVSAGTGSLVADAMQALDRWPGLEAFPDADLRLVPVTAAPAGRKGDIHWSIAGQTAPAAELSGYRGSWQQLVGSLLGASGDRLKPSTTLHPDSTSLAPVLASAAFLNALKNALEFPVKAVSSVAGR